MNKTKFAAMQKVWSAQFAAMGSIRLYRRLTTGSATLGGETLRYDDLGEAAILGSWYYSAHGVAGVPILLVAQNGKRIAATLSYDQNAELVAIELAFPRIPAQLIERACGSRRKVGKDWIEPLVGMPSISVGMV